MSPSFSPRSSEFILVCGLGSLGQQCVRYLKEFGVSVIAIEETIDKTWEIAELPTLLDDMIIGDCRQQDVLQKAKIAQCRAILLVTSSETINVQAAFAARSLNPTVRLIIRSDQQNLNQLLEQQLGNFVAFEATQLPAPAFALAALRQETVGLFRLGHQLVRIIQEQISPDHAWCDRRKLYELNNSTRTVLSYNRAAFCDWDRDQTIRAGDTIVYAEVDEIPQQRLRKKSQQKLDFSTLLGLFQKRNIQHELQQAWQNSSQTQKVGIVASVTLSLLISLGTLLFWWNYPNLTLQDAFFTTAILLLGGYGDLFGQVKLELPIPWGLRIFSLVLAIAGTAFVGVLYALLTERLLTAKFQLLKRRPTVPNEDHIVIVGLGRVGQRIATLLQEMKQPIVGIHSTALEPTILPEMPLLTGKLTNVLTKANLQTARSIIVCTDDEVANLEIALTAREQNPNLNLVIRIFDPRFSSSIRQLLPYARVLGAYRLSAAAFAASAFGESILHLFRLNQQTVLVTAYQITATDTLQGHLLSEVSSGYGIVPILYQSVQEPEQWMPPGDLRLRNGDRLVVIATMVGLRHVEQGRMAAKTWRVRVMKALTQEAQFDGTMAIARITGCEIETATQVMKTLPATLPILLYPHQAQRLVLQLRRVQVSAELVSESVDR
ncbi:NAD-binding protein [Leptolyngbya sp. AN03gr2]|uniref:NAD-binding protein n=1 Tax=unclassified Leptolyngbya TaxID=2650499 RepID=UPI003D319615